MGTVVNDPMSGHDHTHSPSPSSGGSRQYQTAQRLRHTIGGTNKVWACDRCYRLKIKCDSGRPACAACKKHDLESTCTYGGAERTNNSKRGRRYDTAGYVRMLEARVREVEGLLQDKQKNPEPRYSPAPSIPQEYSPIPDVQMEHTSAYDPTPMYGVSQSRVTSQDMFSPQLKYDLCRTFFSEMDFIPSCPIHEPTFFPKMYMERPEHSEFLVTTLCGLAVRHSNHPIVQAYIQQNNIPTYRAGDLYFHHARSLVDLVVSSPSIDAVVGLFFLSLVASSTMGKEGSVKFGLLRQATSMALELRLNIDPDVEEVHGPMPWLAKEIRRRVWWILCSLDTINTLPNEDRPPAIDNRDYPTTDRLPCLQGWNQTPRAPCPEPLFHSVTTEDGLPRLSAFVPGVDFDGAGAMVGLTKIYWRIKQVRGTAWAMAQKAVSGVAEAAPSVTRRERIAEIESDLRAWLASLPEWAQNIDQSDFVPSPASKTPPPWLLFLIHLFYHAAHIALHLPTMLNSTRPPSPTSSPLDDAYVAHAYRICRQHAHNSSVLLRRAQAINPTAQHIGPWGVLFGFYSALVLVMASKASKNPQVLAEVRRDLDAHLWLMTNLSDKYFTADRTLEILMGIIQEGESVDEPVLEAWSGGDRM